MAGTFSFRITEVLHQFTGTVGHIFHTFGIVMDKDAVVGIDRTMLGKDTAVRTVAGSHIGKDSLIEEMLPVIVTAIILVRLLATEHRRSKCFEVGINTFSGQRASFHLPGVRHLKLIQQISIVADNFRIGDTETAPLVRGTELVPVTDTV